MSFQVDRATADLKNTNVRLKDTLTQVSELSTNFSLDCFNMFELKMSCIFSISFSDNGSILLCSS